MQNGIFFCKSLPENRICASFTIWWSQNCACIQTSKIFSGKCNISGCSIVYIVKGFFVGWRTPQKWAVRDRPKGTEMWNHNGNTAIKLVRKMCRQIFRQIAYKAVRRALCNVSFLLPAKDIFLVNFKLSNIYLISGKSFFQNTGFFCWLNAKIMVK